MFIPIGVVPSDWQSYIQAALESARTNNCEVRFLGKTYLTSRLTYKGQSMTGVPGSTIIQGKPLQDIFYAPDPSIFESGSLAVFPQRFNNCGINFKIDNSLNPTVPPASSPNFNRPICPTTPYVLSPTTVSTSDWTVTGTGAVYVAIQGGITSGTAPSHTKGIAIDGNVLWAFYSSAQIYFGNAAFAFPYYDGSQGAPSASFIDHPGFIDCEFTVTNTDFANNCGAFWIQRPFYNAEFTRCVTVRTTYGTAIVPPTTNFVAYDFAPDVNTWKNCFCTSKYNFIAFNMFFPVFDNVQFGRDDGHFNINLLQYRNNNRDYTTGGVFNAFYCEGDSASNYMLGVVMGRNHVFNGGALEADFPPGYWGWYASGCTVNGTFIGNDGTNPNLYFGGSFNTFRCPAGYLGNIVDPASPGTGNSVQIYHSDHELYIGDRDLAVNKPRLGAVQGLDGAFASNGMAGSFFDSIADLWVTPADIEVDGTNTPGTIIKDSTVEGGEYLSIGGNGSFFFTRLNTIAAMVGDRYPACLVRLWFKMKAASGTPTQGLTIFSLSPTTSQATATFSLTTSWQLFFVDVDLSTLAGKVLQPTFNNTSTNVGVSLAWMGIQPIPLGQTPYVGADNGDAAATLIVGASARTQVWNTPLTSDRAVTLSTTGAKNGDIFTVVRTAAATGAHNLNVGTGPLKVLSSAGSSCVVQFNGTAWFLTSGF